MLFQKPERVAVVFGGTGAEEAVSCASAADVLSCMDALAVYIARDGAWYICSASPEAIRDGTFRSRPQALTATCPVRLGKRRGFLTGKTVTEVDVVLPVLHGDGGEDGTVQGTLQTVGLPFVGADTRTGAITCDKSICKTLVQAAGIPVTPFVTWRMGDSVQAARRAIAATFGSHPYPLFLKPTSLGSSVGVRLIESDEQLPDALALSARYGDMLIEPYLSPLREVEIGWLDGDLPIFSDVAEITSHGAFYDYNEKYIHKTAAICLPATLPASLTEQLYAYAKALVGILGLRDLCRMDFFLTQDGTLYFNEVNTFPGFTKESIYPRMLARMGVAYEELLGRLVASAYARRV
ncbi:MAG: D-alanine--D-alanine ligase [Clostridia bacterium]|nr:D-alanine--D-alanine ligase [Clostridia bacterium]